MDPHRSFDCFTTEAPARKRPATSHVAHNHKRTNVATIAQQRSHAGLCTTQGKRHRWAQTREGAGLSNGRSKAANAATSGPTEAHKERTLSDANDEQATRKSTPPTLQQRSEQQQHAGDSKACARIFRDQVAFQSVVRLLALARHRDCARSILSLVVTSQLQSISL